MSAILKQKLIDIANGFTKYGLWEGGGSGGNSSLNAEIIELWSGQQSSSSEITLSDDYANYDVIISMIEPTENYPNEQKFDFMLKGCESLVGGMTENTNYIASYRMYNWNTTSVYFDKINNPRGWNFTLKKIWGIKFVSQQYEYSTEEKVVGKWIDGKPLYQKTVIYDIATTSDFVSIPLDITSPNFIMIYDFTLVDGNTYYGYAQPYSYYRIIDKSSFYLKLSMNNWVVGTTAYITVRYTKTTD